MRKQSLLLVLAFLSLAGKSIAQHKCATDEMHKAAILENPKLAEAERIMNANLKNSLKGMNISSMMRTTSSTGTDTIHIPVAVHIVHQYGSSDYITDNQVYNLIKRMNNTYNLNYDTSSIIKPFKKFAGKSYILFHLASKDPQGNPTKGITRDFSYLTEGGDDQAKINQWSPTSYYNIWFEHVIGRGVAGGTILAYAQFPSSDYDRPGYSGVICASPYIDDGDTMEHETGHYLSLYHTWNSNGKGCAEVPLTCGDDDVDDTPPTPGHYSTCAIYDTVCGTNNFMIYTDSRGGDSLVNYPDTANVQNLMDYSSCTNMFTKGQIERMRSLLKSNIGSRDSLSTRFNLFNTGAIYNSNDLPAIPDFYTTMGTSVMQQFTCPGTPLRFTNKSWRDTVLSVEMNFSNGASTPVSNMTGTSPGGVSYSTSVNNSFTDPGWVTINMKARGNDTPEGVKEFKNIYVASNTATAASAIMEEFDATTIANGNYPIFNYYNNNFKWDYAPVGYYDRSCIMYKGFDTRGYTPCPTGTPYGDYDDFFTPPVDLTAYGTGNCNLNFFSSGASRTSLSYDIRDTLEISYSIDRARTWVKLVSIGKGDLCNKGASNTAYQPVTMNDWSPKTYSIPTAARQNYVVFRFRYKPNVTAPPSSATATWIKTSTGNNFYLDRLSFSQYPTEVAALLQQNAQVVVAPNPTNNGATVIVNNATSTQAKIVVTDVTGKVVFTTEQMIIGNNNVIEIPQAAIATKGMYMVQTITGSQSNTQKLIVY